MTARALLEYHAGLEALPTIYDTCPRECIAPEADQPNGCPSCPVTIKYEAFRRNCERDMASAVARLYDGRTPPPSRWKLDDLISDFRHANRLEIRAGDGDVSGVLELTAITVEIVREEKHLRRRADDEARRRELEDK